MQSPLPRGSVPRKGAVCQTLSSNKALPELEVSQSVSQSARQSLQFSLSLIPEPNMTHVP